jgi:DNA-binding response OmpR family regulator
MSAVILADPETSSRGYLERQLTDDGFEVLGAEEIPEVLDLAERLKPDLVLGT